MAVDSAVQNVATSEQQSVSAINNEVRQYRGARVICPVHSFFKKSHLSAAKQREIRQDVTRTFPELPVYMQEKGKEALFRVLKAYSIYDAEVGYCQGLNFVVAVLLMYLTEEESFWILISLMESPSFSFRDVVRPGFPGLIQHLYIFHKLFRANLPKLHAHFQALGISVPMYATQWYITCFGSCLQIDVVANIIDLFLMQSFLIIHKVGGDARRLVWRHRSTLSPIAHCRLVRAVWQVALSLLKICEAELLTADFDEALTLMMCAARRQSRVALTSLPLPLVCAGTLTRASRFPT